MNDITVGRGETVSIEIQDDESLSVTLLVSLTNSGAPVIEESATFVDGVATITLVNADTDIEEQDYFYQIRLFDAEGEYFNLNDDDCDGGDCTMGTFTVCPSIGESSSS